MNNDIFKSGVALFLITALFIVIIAAANQMTEPIIAQAQAVAVANARLNVLPAHTELELGETYFTGSDRGIVAHTSGYINGSHVGTALELIIQGAQGPITTMVGIDQAGYILNIDFISHTETPGIGDAIERSSFIDEFKGQTWGLSVDSITGATASSSSVINGIDAGLLAFLLNPAEMAANALVGYAVEGGTAYLQMSVAGFAGDIVLEVAVNAGGLVNILILEHNETPAFGGNNAIYNDNWMSQFESQPFEATFDTSSNATVTGNAIIDAVELAMLYFQFEILPGLN